MPNYLFDVVTPLDRLEGITRMTRWRTIDGLLRWLSGRIERDLFWTKPLPIQLSHLFYLGAGYKVSEIPPDHEFGPIADILETWYSDHMAEIVRYHASNTIEFHIRGENIMLVARPIARTTQGAL